jgi:hypothetical protein
MLLYHQDIRIQLIALYPIKINGLLIIIININFLIEREIIREL